MTELFAGRYAFVDLLGSGGMGTVWRVWDAKAGEYRAAKVLSRADSTSLLRFIRETSWRVDHAHVLAPTGWAAEDDRVLFTMPVARGGTVGDLVRDFGPLPDPVVARLLGQLLEALVAVHAAGLVHRDVKPSNLLLDPPGAAPRLLLSDFGIAVRADEPRLTRLGEAVGTDGYTAPEAAGGADPDPAQDVWSAGVVAVELLTGRRPSSGTTQAVGPSALRPLVERMRAADPAARPTAADALAELGSLPLPEPDAEDAVEAFDHLPELPEGWGTAGPDGAPSAPPPAAEPLPEPRTRTMPTDPQVPAAQPAPRQVADAQRPARPHPAPPRPTGGRSRHLAPALLAAVLLVAGAGAIWLGLLLLR